MGAAAIPLVLGGVSTYLGAQQNEMANRRADTANGNQDRLIKMQEDLFNSLKGIVQNADKAGQFDPSQRIAQFKAGLNDQARQDQNSLATSMRISGYKPGDSELGVRSAAMQRNNADLVAKGSDAIRQDAFMQKLNAYQGIGGQQLNPGIGVYGDRAAQAYAQRPNMAGMVGSFMPMFAGGQNAQQVPFKVPSFFSRIGNYA